MEINTEKLEKILLKHWADFLNYKQLMAFTLEVVRDNKTSLTVQAESDLPEKSVQIVLSRFELVRFGFVLWIDFTVPNDNEIAVGTVEAFLSNTGELRLRRIDGHLFTMGLPH